MRLNLPILESLTECKQILIAGMGGGYDVFCGLPIYWELQQRGFQVHLASLTDSSLKRLRGARRLTPSLIGIMATTESTSPYFPELHLARWFEQNRKEQQMIWCFEKLGVRPLVQNYRALVNHLGIDAIILMDGGVDSVMRGDELETGSVFEDAASLAAVNLLDEVQVRISSCLGFGAELEVTHAHVLENLSALAMDNAFLGTCSLVKTMEVYQAYEQALLYVQSQPRQDESVINSSVVSAVRGHYGNYHLTEKTRHGPHQLWISPLMPIYWFFDLVGLAKHNLFISSIYETETFADVRHNIITARQNLNRRQDFRIPLL